MFDFIQKVCAGAQDLTPYGQILYYEIYRRQQKLWHMINDEDFNAVFPPSITIQFVLTLINVTLHNHPVVHHNHFKTNKDTFIKTKNDKAFFTHNLCNLSLKNNKGPHVIDKINVYAHNSGRFDINFLYMQIKHSIFNAGPSDVTFTGK